MMNLCVNTKPWPIGSGCMSGSGALTSGATGWYQLEAQFDTTSYSMHVLFKQWCAPMLRASGYIARLRLELLSDAFKRVEGLREMFRVDSGRLRRGVHDGRRRRRRVLSGPGGKYR